jgi:hypothetical protein
MANWRYTLDIAAEHAAYDREQATLDGVKPDALDEAIDIAELGRRVGAKIKSFLAAHDATLDVRSHGLLEAWASEMEVVGEDDEPVAEYDRILAELYDWGDETTGPGWRDKRCWINTTDFGDHRRIPT